METVKKKIRIVLPTIIMLRQYDISFTNQVCKMQMCGLVAIMLIKRSHLFHAVSIIIQYVF